MKKIYEIASCTSGNVLGIGVDEKITEILDQNERVIICNLLNSESKKSTKTGKKERLKKIRIKKIRKIFKRKNVDFIICNIEEIKKYLKTFIKDSVYINKNMLYIYNISDSDIKEELIKKYQRYNTKIEEIKDGKTTIIKIDNKESKTNKIKDTIYMIIDTFFSIINFISDLLLN